MQKCGCHFASTHKHRHGGFKTTPRRPLKCSALVCTVTKGKVQGVGTAGSVGIADSVGTADSAGTADSVGTADSQLQG